MRDFWHFGLCKNLFYGVQRSKVAVKVKENCSGCLFSSFLAIANLLGWINVVTWPFKKLLLSNLPRKKLNILLSLVLLFSKVCLHRVLKSSRHMVFGLPRTCGVGASRSKVAFKVKVQDKIAVIGIFVFGKNHCIIWTMFDACRSWVE